MLTRCPYCQTRFRIAPAQLKLRMGRVRCGVCDEVFDALDTLSDEAATADPSNADATIGAAEGPCPPEVMPPSVEPVVPERLAAVAEEAGQASLLPEPEMEARADAELESAPGPADDTSGLPASWLAPEMVSPPPRRWPWVVGIIVLTLTACLQLLYTFRIDLAAHAPGLRPTLTAGCALFGCGVPRPLRPDLVSIEASDLVPEGETLGLSAQLKNRATVTLDYPHLEVTLTGPRDEPLVRKVLTPSDYLPKDRDAAKGFSPRGSVDIRLFLAADGVTAVGYRLYLFYP